MKFKNLQNLKELGILVPNFSKDFFETTLYAVRSDDSSEDGLESKAGKFKSHLFVKKEDLKEKIEDVLKTANGYFLQEMIKSEYSGVLFSDGKRQIISAVKGYCEGATSGKVLTDNFYYDHWNFVKKDIFHFSMKKYFGENLELKQPESDISYDLEKVLELGKTVSELFPSCDIEWTFANDTLYCLQARPLNFKLL